jgi:hydroxymethylbilane synthase
METLKIATRESPLALWQANFIANQIKELCPHQQVELIPMTTSGDMQKEKLQPVGGKGLFVKELEEALLDHRADIAVHSMKDVPATFPAGLCLNIINPRQTPFDAFISNQKQTLSEIASGCIIGTTSLRRQSQLLAMRPDLLIKPLRGNVNTRLQKLKSGEFDAIVLAVAGLERLSETAFISEILNEDIMLPACGQGALGIECRQEDTDLHALLMPLNDPISALCVKTERHVNALLGGSCNVPLAVYCKPEGTNEIQLRAKVLSPDGKTVIEDVQKGLQTEAIRLADNCVHALLSKGARKLLSGVY